MDRDRIFQLGVQARIAELETELAELRTSAGDLARIKRQPRKNAVAQAVVEQAVDKFVAHKEGNGKVTPRLRVHRVSDEPAFTSFVTKRKASKKRHGMVGKKWTPERRAKFIATMERLGHFKKNRKRRNHAGKVVAET